MHGAAVLDRERLAQDAAHHQRRARRGQVDHRRWRSPDISPTWASRSCWSTPICATPRCIKKLGLDNTIGPQQLPDRALHAAGGFPEDRRTPTSPSWPLVPCRPMRPICLASSRLLSLLSVGLEVFDLIVVDGPPVMGLADAPPAAKRRRATLSSSPPAKRARRWCRGA